MYVTDYYHLPKWFINELHQQPPAWGFGAFSETIYYARYSRLKEDGTQETWADTVIRNIEGMFSILKTMSKLIGNKWNDHDWHATAMDAATLFFQLKWSPPGRGLWAQGTQFVYERGSDALNNCAFVSIQQLSRDSAWLKDMLMKGVGVGFDTDNLRHTTYYRPDEAREHTYVIPDSREGWVESVRRLLESYETRHSPTVRFDYSQIRMAGEPIRGFGGVSSGPAPLQELHERLRRFMGERIDGKIDQTQLILDVENAIGTCVIAGNVRRSAEIALGRPGDRTFLNAKNEELFPGRSEWMHMSNNSLALRDEADFDSVRDIIPGIIYNGEPGLVNFTAIRQYGRLKDQKFDPAIGINPCGEVPLESYETCNLIIVYPTRNRDKAELTRSTQYATLYGMAVTLLPSDNPLTRSVVDTNHRIGVGMSGLADLRESIGAFRTAMLLDDMYTVVQQEATRLAKMFGIDPSIRLTTIKPDGTASLLAGVSPGMHWPWAPFVLRRVRQAKNSAAAERLIAAGVPHEPEEKDPENTLVFEFPIMYGGGKTRAQKDVSAEEQVGALTSYQTYWADNSVSCTISFRESDIPTLPELIERSVRQLKSVSFLRDQDNDTEKVYAQAPNEAITQEEYIRRTAQLKQIDWQGIGSDGMMDKFCDAENGVCLVL